MLVIELQETIKAPTEEVWSLVSDVRGHHQFAGYEILEVRQTNVGDLGPDFRWHERGVLLGKRYECECRVFGWEPPEWFCFGTPNLFQVSFELEPVRDGTRLVYRVELPQTPEARHEAIAEVCRDTMRRLRRLLGGA